MTESVQCLNCGKFYPAFVERRPLRRTRAGTLSDGGYGCLFRIAGLGVVLLVIGGALWGMNTLLFNVFSHSLILWLLIVGAVIALPAFIFLIAAGTNPDGWQYRCKSCGNAWQVETARKRAS